jgi:hypothetical protein
MVLIEHFFTDTLASMVDVFDFLAAAMFQA